MLTATVSCARPVAPLSTSSHWSIKESEKATRDLHPDIAIEVAEQEVRTVVEEEKSDNSVSSHRKELSHFEATGFYQKI